MAINPDLFKRGIDTSEIVNQKIPEIEIVSEPKTWEEFFKNSFDEPVGDPQRVEVLVKRHLPSQHPENKIGEEFVIPYQFSFDDKNGERWYGIIFDLGKDQLDWQFLFFKPDRFAYLSYLRGEIDLLTLYQTTIDFYIARPEVAKKSLVQVPDPREMPKALLPKPNTFYSDNIWFNKQDVFWGMNTANSTNIIELAKQNRFY